LLAVHATVGAIIVDITPTNDTIPSSLTLPNVALRLESIETAMTVANTLQAIEIKIVTDTILVLLSISSIDLRRF